MNFNQNISANLLLSELKQYKRKYYLNILLKGVLVTCALLLATYILLNTLEYFGRFNTIIRGIFFYSFAILASLTTVFWILIPISKLLNLNRQITDEEAARQIGNYFPEIDDKLLNTIQLYNVHSEGNALILASIEQRTRDLAIVRFTDAIELSENRKYLRYLLPLLLLILTVFIIAPQFFTESSIRILNYTNQYIEPAPFQFELKNEELEAFKNEDFTLNLALTGRAIPQEVYLIAGGRRYKMEKDETNAQLFSYTYNKIQNPVDFSFEAAGFNSLDYRIELKERPILLSFDAYLSYPAYLGKANENWNNIGNLVVPEGTEIVWKFSTNQVESLDLFFNKTTKIEAAKTGDKNFELRRTARSSENYEIRLKNEFSENKEEINYYINVIPDQFPKISMQEFKDEEMFSYLSVGGSVSDDYGLSGLKLFYKIDRDDKEGAYQSILIPINDEQTIQNFYYNLDLNTLNLKPGDKITYFAQVWDNDGVNGAKSAKTTALQFKIPNKEDLKDDIDNSVSETENQMDKTIKKAQQLKGEIEKIEKKLQSKNSMDYQDKKSLEELLKKRDELVEEVKKLQEQNEMINEKQERFSEKDQELKEKMDQLKELMDQLLDEETKKLYEELKKLLEQNRQNDEILNKLDKIEQKEENLENELERALEMFKQLQFEQKLEQSVEDLKELAEEQEKLAEKTEESKKQDLDAIKEEQEKLNEKFEEIKKELDELKEMDKELESPNGMKDTEQKEEEISKEQQEATQELENNQKKEAEQSQKDAAQKMQEMSEEMEQMQSGMEQEQSMENIDDLRAILENLVQLSFDQEALMKEFKMLSVSDPRFIKLAQEQLKLQDDAQIIKDSLLALSKRVFQIQSFVTRELGEMNDHMDNATVNIKERKLPVATGKQQLAMTSMNNLALMLNDALQQMQEQMANSMKSGKGKKGKQKSKGNNLSQLQQQLNERIEKLKNGNQSGRELSEELAKLAAEQARIRQALKELEEKSGSGGKEGKDELSKQIEAMKKMMEETEKDLVNKNIKQSTLDRQKEIETRLLESEKSLQERGEEEERKAESAKEKVKRIPANLNQYFQNKEKQIELLKTIPPSMSPYYKKEIDEYFEKIEE